MRQALYRMYRPTTFDEVLGQSHILPILQNQIKTNTISHAYLFAGPRGTGKTSTAKLFAQALNNGNTMDVIELDAASNNSVEDMREIVDNAALAPFGGGYKIYILDEAHMLSKSAFNALLKTLEEPPAHVIFILATTEPERIPKTILSRTLRFDFVRITEEIIAERLKTVLEAEGISYEEDALRYIAQKSDGALRDALSLLDKALSYGEITAEHVRTALGTLERDHPYQMLQALTSGNLADALTLLHTLEGQGVEPRVFVQDMILYLRDLILHKNGIANHQSHLEEASALLDDASCAYMIEALSGALAQMKTSPKPDLQLLAALVPLATSDLSTLAAYRSIPANVKKLLDAQKAELLELRKELSILRSERAMQVGYPQNFVDNPQKPVDKSADSASFLPSDAPELSTSAATNEGAPAIIRPTPESPASLQAAERSSHVDPTSGQSTAEHQRMLSDIMEQLPKLHAALKQQRAMHISSLLRNAEPMRFDAGVLYFVYRGVYQKLCKTILLAKPNNIVDPILTELLGREIATRYITEDELPGTPPQVENPTLAQLRDAFPDIHIEQI